MVRLETWLLTEKAQHTCDPCGFDRLAGDEHDPGYKIRMITLD